MSKNIVKHVDEYELKATLIGNHTRNLRWRVLASCVMWFSLGQSARPLRKKTKKQNETKKQVRGYRNFSKMQDPKTVSRQISWGPIQSKDIILPV